MNKPRHKTDAEIVAGSTAKPLTANEAREAVGLSDLPAAEPTATQPPSRTVAAGLEYLARLEAENEQLRKERDQQEKSAKLDTIELEELRRMLAQAESRVAELQIRSDEAVRKEAGLKATLEAVIRTALFGADPSQTIAKLAQRLDDHAKLNS